MGVDLLLVFERFLIEVSEVHLLGTAVAVKLVDGEDVHPVALVN